MNRSVIIGLVLIGLGVLALVYRGINYTKREEVLKIGPLQATAEKTEHVPIPTVIGWLAVGGGVVLVVLGARKA